MLTLIGLGLHDERDLSLRAVDALKDAEKVYFESYTSYFHGNLERIGEMCGKQVISLDRADIEENPEENVLSGANACLLVAGDPLVATTHSDLVLRAWEKGIKVRVIHSASVYSAIGETGLQLYKFGKTTTIAYKEGDWFPKSPYETLKENTLSGLHTMCLLDVKADQNRYMSVPEAIGLLLEMEEDRFQNIFKPERMCVGVARLGGDAVIRYGTAEKLGRVDFGGPPHVLIVPGKLHFMEEKILSAYEI